MSKSNIEKRMDQLLDELLQTQTTEEKKKSDLRKKIMPIYQELNRDESQKRNPYWLPRNRYET